MMTATTPTTATADAPAPEVRERKRRTNFSTALRGPGEGETLRVYLKQRKDGTAITYAVHVTKDGKKKKSEKGATERHPGLEPAKATVEKLVADAVKLGWKIPERKGNFQTKPDAFDATSLPAPGAPGVAP